jgi:hypothetical protein
LTRNACTRLDNDQQYVSRESAGLRSSRRYERQQSTSPIELQSVRTFEMMKQILKAGPNQMETLRRLRTEAATIDKDVTVRSERIRQTRDFRIRFWFREKTMEQRFAASQHSDPSRSGTSGDKTS